MNKDIIKIYWITHPAFSVGEHSKEAKRTPREIQEYIQQQIIPIVEKAQKNPDSLIVLIKSPTYAEQKGYLQRALVVGRISKKDFEQVRKLSPARHRKMIGIEKSVEQMLIKALGKRAIVVKGRKYTLEVAEEVRQESRKKGFKIRRDATIERYGSYENWCAAAYPEEFRSRNGMNGKIYAKKGSTIPKTKRRLK